MTEWPSDNSTNPGHADYDPAAGTPKTDSSEDQTVADLINRRLFQAGGLEGISREELCMLLGMCTGTISRLRVRLQQLDRHLTQQMDLVDYYAERMRELPANPDDLELLP